MYNFDEIIDRSQSGAIKYCALQERYGASDLTPLWVADMDFATPPFIIDELRRRLEHPILGYTQEPKAWRNAIIEWTKGHYGWSVEPDWIRFIPGIVKGIGMAVNVFTSPRDKVIIQPPVYNPFCYVPQLNGRRVAYNPLLLGEDGRYSINFAQLEQTAADPECKMLILCNPHNPGGRVWTRSELAQVADICYRHGVLVVSDEIHCDLVLWGGQHTPFATVSPEAAENSITFQAPSKTFNIAGLVSSLTIVPSPKVRKQFFGWLDANELGQADIFAHIAAAAAYTPQGDAWRRELLHYVEGNIEAVEQFFATQLPQIKPLRPDASFLIWLDCRALGLSQDALLHLFVNKARLALIDGTVFGIEEGTGFMRLNVGCPRALLMQALSQLKSAII